MLFTAAGRKVFLFVSGVHRNIPTGARKSDAGHALQGVGEGPSQAGAPELEKLQKESLIKEELLDFYVFFRPVSECCLMYEIPS